MDKGAWHAAVHGVTRVRHNLETKSPGDSIPGLGRCLGEGNANTFQCSWWRIPWTEEPGGLHGVTKVRHDGVCTYMKL